jgi:hypothetical protein
MARLKGLDGRYERSMLVMSVNIWIFIYYASHHYLGNLEPIEPAENPSKYDYWIEGWNSRFFPNILKIEEKVIR